MSNEEPQFALVICHGSYHTPTHYEPFMAALRSKGIEVYCPQLPSSDLRLMNVGDVAHPDYDRDPPPGGAPQQDQDVKVLKELLDQLIVRSAVPELQEKDREAKGAKGGIFGIFYACGFVVTVGESITSSVQPKDGSPPVIPPFCRFHKHGFAGIHSTQDGAKYFFNGLNEADAKRYEAMLTASAILLTPLTNDVYGSLPCAYLVTENDMAMPTAYQESVLATLQQRSEVDPTVHRCPSGHSPQLAWIDELVAKVQEFARYTSHKGK